MSLCFPSIYIHCCMSKHINHTRGKSNPSLENLPLSIDETAFSSTFLPRKYVTRPVNSHTNRPIGIIGGVSADSTSGFAKKLVRLNQEGEANEQPFILCSDPSLSDELLSLGRSSLSCKVEPTDIDHGSLVENLRLRRMYLEKSGVSCIVMPCHLSHAWYDEVTEECSVPFLHMGECVAKELKGANLRPLEAGSPLRIGVLSTNEALVARFYQEKLRNEGFEVILPDKATIEHIVIPAVEALGRKDYEGAKNLVRIGVQVLLVRAVNRIVLACDDLQQVLPLDDPLLAKCIDPMDALARSAVKYAQSTRI